MEDNKLRNTEEGEDVQLIPIVKLCWSTFLIYWKWFLLSVIICLGLGWLYQQRQSRVYQRQTVMLIEDAEPSGMSGVGGRKGRSNMSTLLELNGISVGNNLKNEIFILTSHRLMERVVDSLKLDVDYTTEENLHDVTLYRERPFEVEFQKPTDEMLQFSVSILDANTCLLANFAKRGESIPGEKKVRVGEVVSTPVGALRIVKNAAYKEFPTEQEIKVTRLPKKIAANIYQARVSATEYDKESSLIVISCSDMSSARAEDILNEVFNAYKRDVVDNKNRVAQSTARFIDSRIALIGSELGEVENKLADFKQRNRLVNLQTDAQLFAQESSEARRRSIELETQLSVAQFLADHLRSTTNKNDVIPAVSGLNGAGFDAQISEYNNMMLKRNQLAANSSENSPAINEYDVKLASLRSSIIASLQGHVNSMKIELREARAHEARLSGRVGNVPEQEKYGMDIQRQQALKEALYTYLLNKREEVALQLAINEANVRLVEPPLGSPYPISPRKSIIMAIALLLGLLIPSAVLWLKALFDVTVTGRRDVEKHTTVPIVGEVPRWDGNKGEQALVTQCSPDEPVVEAFRLLRYGLNFMKRTAKVLVTTSTTPDQGKSFISRNLAVVFAMAGKRVLLIDADIRKRTQSAMFGKTDGLTTYLAAEEGEVDLQDLIVADAVSQGVDFLPAGLLPPNPSELLMSHRFEEMVEMLRDMYDYVIIDTTPVVAVADASLVARVADMTLYVVRVGVQERDFLPEIEKMYKEKKFRNLCIVLNDANARRSYGYGYGYGYGAQKKRKGLFGRKK